MLLRTSNLISNTAGGGSPEAPPPPLPQLVAGVYATSLPYSTPMPVPVADLLAVTSGGGGGRSIMAVASGVGCTATLAGATATLTVTAASGSCSYTVADTAGQTATGAITLTPVYGAPIAATYAPTGAYASARSFPASALLAGVSGGSGSYSVTAVAAGSGCDAALSGGTVTLTITGSGASCGYTVADTLSGQTANGVIAPNFSYPTLTAAAYAPAATINVPLSFQTSALLALVGGGSGSYTIQSVAGGTSCSASLSGASVTVTATASGGSCSYTVRDSVTGGTQTAAIAPSLTPAASCNALHTANPALASGAYTVRPVSTDITVYCDMVGDDGGWTLIAYNDATTTFSDFDRTWADYKAGWGGPKGGAYTRGWIGNESIRALTSGGKNLLVRNTLYPGGSVSKHFYNGFTIDTEANKYRLSLTASPSSNDGGSFVGFAGVNFTTRDVDNDSHSGMNCALNFKAAWWHTGCYAMTIAGNDRSRVYWRTASAAFEDSSAISMWIR